jgi:alpha,alpha-trehalase
MLTCWLLFTVPVAVALYQNGSVTAPCDSPLYCQGEILREIELARPFEDSKTYVDLSVSFVRDRAIDD